MPEATKQLLYLGGEELNRAYLDKYKLNLHKVSNWNQERDQPFCQAIAENTLSVITGTTSTLI